MKMKMVVEERKHMGQNVRENIEILLKGAWVGGTMTVPGVSGGTMAMVLGIYDRLISSVSRVFKDPKRSIPFLLWFALGGTAGILLFSKGISLLLASGWAVPARFFFLGAVGGGIPLIFREAGIRRFGSGEAVFLGIGIVSALFIGLIPEGLFTPAGGGISDFLIQVAGGVIIAVALVLPGISASQMLYMLGIYESTLNAVGSMDIAALIPLAAGGLLGTFFSARVLEGLLEKHTRPTFLIILGFMLASLPELFPGIPEGIDVVYSLTAVYAGFMLLYKIGSVN